MSYAARILTIAAIAGSIAACSDAPAGPASASVINSRSVPSNAAGGVYTMTNSASGNAIVAFQRAADGSLTSLGTFATGGNGVGGTVDPLASQYSVLLTSENDVLLVVNAGSNDVSSFRVGKDASLDLASTQSSGGERPVSLAQDGNIVYVLNAGDNTVSGLRLTGGGKLVSIPKSTRSLSAGAAGASTIAFTPDGRWLIATERLSNRIETFGVEANGRLSAPVITASNGAVPFGFDVTPSGHPVISEAGGAVPNGAVSSYSVGANGGLSTITASLDGGGKATCWLILTADGRYAFAANSASDAIAALSVGSGAALTLLNATAATTAMGSIPIDLDLTEGDQFLYTLEAGSGKIGGFAVGTGGTLASIAAVSAGAGRSGLQGVAAW